MVIALSILAGLAGIILGICWIAGVFRLGPDVREACSQLSDGHDPGMDMVSKHLDGHHITIHKEHIRKASIREYRAFKRAEAKYHSLQLEERLTEKLLEE